MTEFNAQVFDFLASLTTRPENELLCATGLSALWQHRWEKTFAILTGEPNELMATTHDRMTTFLEPRDYEKCWRPPNGRQCICCGYCLRRRCGHDC